MCLVHYLDDIATANSLINKDTSLMSLLFKEYDVAGVKCKLLPGVPPPPSQYLVHLKQLPEENVELLGKVDLLYRLRQVCLWRW